MSPFLGTAGARCGARIALFAAPGGDSSNGLFSACEADFLSHGAPQATLPAIPRAIFLAQAMIVIIGFTPSEVGRMEASAT